MNQPENKEKGNQTPKEDKLEMWNKLCDFYLGELELYEIKQNEARDKWLFYKRLIHKAKGYKEL
jgi:hypothetical protein